MNVKEWRAYGKRHYAKFKGANPFPHIVFNNQGIIPAKWVEGITFPDEGSPLWNRNEHTNSKKRSCQRIQELNFFTRKTFGFLNGKQFLAFLEGLTGIERLKADPTYNGGGLHLIPPGGFLNIHADFNFLPNGDYRRLNVLLYLNRDWEPGHGELELRDIKLNLIESVPPRFNTMVIFETSINSYHGHPNPLPEGIYRKSIATYYYTRRVPEDANGEAEHSTIYKEV